ncbi:MAG: SpoIIE family protein phosphatase, partial [Pseudomonadota bacterium]
REMPTQQKLVFENDEQLNSILDDLKNNRSGNIRTRRNGRDYLALYEPLRAEQTLLMLFVPIENLIMPALQSAENALSSTDRYVNSLIPFSALLVAVIMFLAFVGSRRFVKPINDLVAAVNRVGEGDFSTRVAIKTGDEFEQLGNAFNALMPQLEEHTRVRQDLAVARAVQQRLLPEAPPDFPGIELAGHTLYAEQTGGDYYDFIPLDKSKGHRLGIVLGDVAGHGVASALMMASVRALLHGSVNTFSSPAATLNHINQNLADDLHAGQFMTLFYLIFDPQKKLLTWVDAGHDPAIIYSPRDDKISYLAGEDIPLGVDQDWLYKHDSETITKPDDIYMLGTDGLWETKSSAGEQFGKQRLENMLRQHHADPVATICQKVLDEIAQFRGDQHQQDDISLVIFRFGDIQAAALSQDT